MVIKIGINSFGRIGRVIFRTCCENSEIEVSAINDPAIEIEYMCYLIKFDSTHGKFSGTVSHEGNIIKVNDQSVKVFHHNSPADIQWHEAGVQYVVEASGMFTSVSKASGHLTSDGVRRVVVTAPSADAPMLVLGVNENTIQPDMKVISCASSTLYCLAPIVKILEDTYGVADGFVTSIHAMTPSLKPLDGLCMRGKHWRDHRSIHQNIIPAATGACRALARVVPAARGKLAGLAFRVPVVNGSVLDISVRLNKTTTIAEISKAIEDSKNSLLRDIIQVSNEKAVSSDFAGDTHSCVLDTESSLQIKPNFFKLICWYENEYSYSCRVVDTVLFLERQFQAQIPISTRFMYMRPTSSNFQQIERSQGDVRGQYVSFCLPHLQNNRSNDLSSIEVRPSTAQYSIHQLSKTIPENKDRIKSYIDRLTTCKCNEEQNKIHVVRKNSTEDKAENCFKKVEKDISEMLNMAEDLLNKSSSKKIQSAYKYKKTSEKDLENRNIMRKNIIAKISDTLEKIRKVKINTQDTDFTGDQIDALDDYQHKVSRPTNKANSLNNSRFELPNSNLPTNTVNSNASLKKMNTWMYKKNPDVKKMNENNKSYIEKDLFFEYSTNDHKEDDTSTIATIVGEKLQHTLKYLNNTTQTKSKVTDKFPEKYNEELESNNHNNQSEKNMNPPENKDITKTVVEITNIEKKVVFDILEHVKQQGIELEESASVNNMNEDKNSTNYFQEVDEKTPENIENFPGCSSSPIENDSEKSMSGIVSTVPAMSKNNSSHRHTEDIYDKLDSESVSGSGSSYKISEKTSQIINITDLTYSLEDLPRLDKICRVIEISDELSDKLFAPLDNANYENNSKKKWSFQDMCERIKFDDFCNELFEKSP